MMRMKLTSRRHEYSIPDSARFRVPFIGVGLSRSTNSQEIAKDASHRLAALALYLDDA